MRTRKLGPLEVSVVGLGCNNFGGRVDAEGTRAVVDAALDAGVTFFDTADIYGNKGGSETLLGEVLQGRRDQVVLATKFGHHFGPNGEPLGQNSRPEYIKQMTEASLKRLRIETIDLYYQHRVDPDVPIEEVAGAVKDLILAGKVKQIKRVSESEANQGVAILLASQGERV